MGDITKNLSRYEMACQCGCGFDTVDAELAAVIQECVDHFNRKYPHFRISLKVNSGCRCEDHNKAEGGSPKSQHLKAKAMDFYLYDKKSNTMIDPDEVYNYFDLKYRDKYGVGRYNGRTHVDVRPYRARWDLT